MFGKRQCDVLVVGAGPVGLFTALTLKQRSVDVAIVDKLRRTGLHGYALALHPRSLQLLDLVGVATDLIERGRRLDRISFHDSGGERCQIDFSRLGGAFPFALVLPQGDLEGALERRLLKERVKVRWNHRLESLNFDVSPLGAEVSVLDQVTTGYPIARLEWQIAKTLRYKASFIVGADGYQSTIRKALGIGYRQIRDVVAYSVFEFDSPIEPDNEVRVVLDQDGSAVLWPMSENRCRWGFSTSESDPHRPTLEELNRLIGTRAPWFPAVSGEIHWSGRVHFDQRLAESFGRDRVWLAGDAAHLTGPVGAQSMNAGLVEADAVGRRLAGGVGGGDIASALSEYDSDRQAEWGALLDTDGALQARSDADRWVAEHASKILGSIPATGEDLRTLLTQVGLELTN
jgi:2-polyprenyl-6-methoxyphenol hydroxylase-like FAD-dependent oxidoreductase